MPELNVDEKFPEAIFRWLVDSVRDYAIFLLDTTGHVRTWNPGAQRIKQYAADEIIGKHFSTFYPTVDVRSGKPEYELRGALETGRFEDEGWRVRKDGSRFWANVIITPVYDDDQQHLGFSKVTRDLTERKHSEDEREILLQAEREARERAETTREQLEAMHALTAASVTHLDTSSLVGAFVDDVSAMLGADKIALFLLQDDGYLQPIGERGLPELMQHDMRMKVGEGIAGGIMLRQQPMNVEDVRVLRQRYSVLEDNHVVALMGVPLILEGRPLGVILAGTTSERRFHANDLTLMQIAAERIALAIDRARALESERAARAETAAANEAARLRDQFLALAAHELKTPLTGLRMGAQLALRRQREGAGERVTSLLQQVLGEADRVNRLISQLLDAARLNEGRVHLRVTHIDVSELVMSRVSMARQFSDAVLEVRVPEHITADVDDIRVGQVVTNLLDNAVKFSPPGLPIVVSLEGTPDEIRFVVEDRGPGIPIESVPHIFERFYQADAGRIGSGLGLGLFIVEQIVSAHGGTIAVDCPESGGSRFTVTLPRVIPSPSQN